MSFDIQIVSDLHLEFIGKKDKYNLLKPSARHLALLGDICCVVDNDDFNIFKAFINEILPLYDTIIMVSGNHEGYTKVRKPTSEHTLQYTHEKIRSFFRQTSKKLHYLQNNTLKIKVGKKKYHIIGTTLWSYIPPEAQPILQKSLSDYKNIYVQDNKDIRRLLPSDVTAMFKHNYSYIRNQIIRAKEEGATTIVLTHHCPFIKPTYGKDLLDYGYYTNCKAILDRHVVLWGYGHTHIKDNHVVNGTRFYSMPKGYPGQHTEYVKDASLSV